MDRGKELRVIPVLEKGRNNIKKKGQSPRTAPSLSSRTEVVNALTAAPRLADLTQQPGMVAYEQGRWHYHAAVEPPSHVSPDRFEQMINDCWHRVHWGYNHIKIVRNADRGWIDYMLKLTQKSALEAWEDCIDIGNFYNPIVVV